MKKCCIVAMIIALAAGFSFADTLPTDQDYQDLEQTRVKLIRMKREMDRFMKELVGPYADKDLKAPSVFGNDVRVDVAENDNDVTVKADLPGMSKDKIDILLEKNKILKISGTREVTVKTQAPGMVRQERSSGYFERTLELPQECENSGIKATYNEGVLEVTLKKKKDAKKESVKVNVQ